MRVEQVDGEDTYFVGQVTDCFMIDAARFGTQLDRLGDLVPITCYGIKLVHIRLDGCLTRVRRVTGGFAKLMEVLSFLLKNARGFHFVASDAVSAQVVLGEEERSMRKESQSMLKSQ